MTHTPLDKYAKAIFHAKEQPKGMVLSVENVLADVADYAMSLEAESERLREESDRAYSRGAFIWRDKYVAWRKTAAERWDYGEQVRMERDDARKKTKRLVEAVIAERDAEKDCVALRNWDMGFEGWADVEEVERTRKARDAALAPFVESE